ncbi:hypothetical protein FACS1894188_11340 [Clostridia bacterium]|nr:hypothetical protein FACS1894188_11340 [Clostridia bacterium]
MELTNGIIYSEKATENGIEGYMIQQIGEDAPSFMPTYQMENGEITAELNPTDGLYYTAMDYSEDEDEQELLNERLGTYGEKWQKFMTEKYPAEALQLKLNCQWEILSRRIDREAYEMDEILTEQYTKQNPPPQTTEDFFATLNWRKTMRFYVEHEVMEQIVLTARTA